jgi:hypothetical protein
MDGREMLYIYQGFPHARADCAVDHTILVVRVSDRRPSARHFPPTAVHAEMGGSKARHPTHCLASQPAADQRARWNRSNGIDLESQPGNKWRAPGENSRTRSSPVPAENTDAAHWPHLSVRPSPHDNGVRPVSRSTVHLLQGRTSSTESTVSAPRRAPARHYASYLPSILDTCCSRAREVLFLPFCCPSPDQDRRAHPLK